MKTISGYLILFISFFGLIYLKHFFSFNQDYPFDNGSTSVQKYFTSEVKIDSKMRNRIAKLEKVVDSLMVKNEDVEFIESPILKDKIPKPAPTPQPQLTDSRNKRVNKDLFLSLNDAAKIRDKRTKLSLIAQEYINLAYELGGNSWYGAEEVWGTEDFINRINELHEDDG